MEKIPTLDQARTHNTGLQAVIEVIQSIIKDRANLWLEQLGIGEIK